MLSLGVAVAPAVIIHVALSFVRSSAWKDLVLVVLVAGFLRYCWWGMDQRIEARARKIEELKPKPDNATKVE